MLPIIQPAYIRHTGSETHTDQGSILSGFLPVHVTTSAMFNMKPYGELNPGPGGST